jgi:2-oxoglutarate ferredoxin oxidoreductase subunit delta
MAKGKITIEIDRCKGCALCVDVCPKGLIQIDKECVNARGYYPAQLVDPEGECTGCAICAVACPDVAITVYRAPKPAKRRDGTPAGAKASV